MSIKVGELGRYSYVFNADADCHRVSADYFCPCNVHLDRGAATCDDGLPCERAIITVESLPDRIGMVTGWCMGGTPEAPFSFAEHDREEREREERQAEYDRRQEAKANALERIRAVCYSADDSTADERLDAIFGILEEAFGPS